MDQTLPLIIRPALPAEARALALLGTIASDQKSENGSYLSPANIVFAHLKDDETSYAKDFQKPHYSIHVAEAPAFENILPVFGSNGAQLAGFSMGYITETMKYHIGHIYAVKSPHRTGSALLAHEITHAMKADARMITTWPITQRSINMVTSCGFERLNGHGEYYALNHEKFPEALEKLNPA